jgi:capsular exopolysaccharide synthesis family protein
MSQLFEALQRSESERLGGARPPSSAADLLQIAENDTVPVFAAPTTPAPVVKSASGPLVLNPDADSRLLCISQAGSLAAEKFRVLALRLKHLREERKLRSVVITSTMPEEGKSLISANLAVTLARSRQFKTLLLDADMRRPTLAKLLVGRSLPGLSECLQSDQNVYDYIHETDPGGFSFLPAGFPPVNPLELMQSQRFQQILQTLKVEFDWILVDSPPVLPLADTSLLMRSCEGVLMIAREGVTEKKLLQKALEVVDPAFLLGIVLNGSSNNDHENYYQRYANSSEAEPS